MKKKITAVILSLLILCMLSVSAYAADGDLEFKDLPMTNEDVYDESFGFGDDYDLFKDDYDYDDYDGYYDYYDADEFLSDELIEEMLSDSKFAMMATLLGMFSLMFLPCVVVLVVFIILNSKTKKKIKEYERLIYGGGINMQMGYNPQQGGFNPQQQGFNPQQGGFNPAQPGFNQGQPGFNPANQGFNPQGNGYNPEQGRFGWQNEPITQTAPTAQTVPASPTEQTEQTEPTSPAAPAKAEASAPKAPEAPVASASETITAKKFVDASVLDEVFTDVTSDTKEAEGNTAKGGEDNE